MMIMRRFQGAGLWGIAGLAEAFGHGAMGKQSRETDDKLEDGREKNNVALPSAAQTVAHTSDVASSSATAASTMFETEWEYPGLHTDGYKLNTPYDILYKIPRTPDVRISEQGVLALTLLWTSAVDGVPNATNTYMLTGVSYDCPWKSESDHGCRYDAGANGTALLNLRTNTEVPHPPYARNIVNNFFLCFAKKPDSIPPVITCESYSDFFSVDLSLPARLRPRQNEVSTGSSLQKPSSTIAVTHTTAFVMAVETSPPTVTAPATTAPPETIPTNAVLMTSIGESTTLVYVSLPTSGTTTILPSSQATSSPAAALSTTTKSKSGGLGTGLIVGIAIAGAAALIIIALVIFFLRRRSARKRQLGAEHVLLTDNMSRDLVSEKSNMSPSSSSGPMLPLIVAEQPASGVYDHLASSAPYNGPAGKRSTLKPAQIQHTELVRGRSDASSGGPVSPRSTNLSQYEDGDEEPYHDVPIYGDARRAPQVYQSGLQAPFLSEPGMTDEELSRLEEEERRIDAAIEEAERRR